MTDPLPPAIPAATLVIFRDAPQGPPEILMVERALTMAFAGGALVFPGGRVDPGDHEIALSGADCDDADLEDHAARIAAIRETIEEAGVGIGLSASVSADDLSKIRTALRTGTTFADALAEVGAVLDVTHLEYFARWRPAHAHRRIFDTRFYLARLPDDAVDATVDQTENVRLLWATARHILDEADAGRIQIIFPTRRNLERIAQYADFDAAVADARGHPVRAVTPWIERRDGVDRLCIPDDLGYPVISEPMTSVIRG